MRFQEIRIKNFRGILDAELKNLKQFNIILGKNNACKTTLLEAVFSITGMSNPQIPDRINTFRGISPDGEEGFRYLFHNLDFKNIPKIEADFDTNETKRTLKILPEIVNSVIEVQKTKLEDLDSSSSSSNEIPTTVNGINFHFTFKEKHKKTVFYKSKMTIENENATIETDKKYKEKLSAVFAIASLMKVSLSIRLEKIIVEKRKQEIINILQKIDSSIKDISLGKNKVYVDIGGDRLMPINIMGDGIIKVLYLIVMIYDNRDGVVLIDEIGNGLHYSAITTLWKAVFKAAKQFNTQLFITTHNREILKYLNEVLEEDNFKTYQDKVMIQTVRKLDNNVIKAYNYGFEELHHAIEYDNEIR
jgi:AAA15 family ATPase/GTPase